MKQTKAQKGITLVALIITIIILLILAVVAIRAVQGDGILKHAKDAKAEYGLAQDKEQINLSLLEWKMVNATGNTTFEDYLKGKFGEDKVTVNGEGEIIVTLENGNQYKVTENGEITSTKGISITATGMPLNIEEGTTPTGTLTAILSGIEGEITWSNENNSIATISATKGESITVTAVAKGETKVTATCVDYIATYTVIVKEKLAIALGDKVAYNEGYSATKTSTVDSAFVMDDMDWRVLDVEDDGTVKLISTQPTTSELRLSGENGWLNAEENLDKLCSDLYANGEGVTARSLKVEDIDKLAGIVTEEDKKACTSDYGSWWRYKYDPTAERIQYSTSTDYNPETKTGTWTDYANTSYAEFKAPGETKIDSTNYQDAEGNPIVNEQKYSYYEYRINNKVTSVTSDGIRMADLITKGLNDDNNAASGSDLYYWISSCRMRCCSDCVYYYVLGMLNGDVSECKLWRSGNKTNYADYPVRPVVILSSEMFGEKVDGVWQVNI